MSDKIQKEMSLLEYSSRDKTKNMNAQDQQNHKKKNKVFANSRY